MNHKLLAPYSLKWNPFAPEVPVEALWMPSRLARFCARVERQVREGGFVSVVGVPGTGKSVALRLLADRLGALRDVKVHVLTRPQSGLTDLYRELADIFEVRLRPYNRWGGTKVLRECWQQHIEASLFRPVLLIDEAQEMKSPVLCELRLLMSKDLDSCALLTVVLCGDLRLPEKLRLPDLQPVASRIRAGYLTGEATRDELLECLAHALGAAGNPKLMTSELMAALCDHSAGNLRTLMNSANELLQAGLERDGSPLDEKLFFEVFDLPQPARRPAASKAR
jgi:general secretion pathway protein A